MADDAPASPVSVTVIVYVPVEGWAAAAFPVAGAATTCVVTLIDLTEGGLFCGRYDTVTLVSVARLRPCAAKLGTPLHKARIRDSKSPMPFGFASGADHSLQVLSGRAELPAEFETPGRSRCRCPRQLICPHRETEPASCTGDS